MINSLSTENISCTSSTTVVILKEKKVFRMINEKIIEFLIPLKEIFSLAFLAHGPPILKKSKNLIRNLVKELLVSKGFFLCINY
jgi:hypothetical protein